MTRAARHLTLASMAVGVVACTFTLDWDPAGLPCLNGECDDGHTCLVNRCVPDGSLTEGATCNLDVQCESPFLCAPRYFTCRKDCATRSFFRVTADCATGDYCAPVWDESAGGYSGFCVESDGCRTDDDCPRSHEVCTTINSTTTACLPGCRITWTNTTYGDNCGGTPEQRRYCQPVGPVAQAGVDEYSEQSLVCFETADEGEAEGNVCELVSRPCQAGLACVGGRCTRFCNPALSSSGAPANGCTHATYQLCCPRNYASDSDAPQTVGLCSEGC